MTEEQKTEEVVTEQKGPQLPDLLKKLPGAPTQKQIDDWKDQYGDVFVSGFSETEIFIWRALFRPEWVELQSAGQKEGWTQFKLEEETCGKCVLWPKTNWEKAKAGTASTVHEQIMQNSNFLNPQAAAYLVAKL